MTEPDPALEAPRIRRNWLFAALALAAICAAILLTGSDPSEVERRFAGRWHFRSVLLALATGWHAVVCLVAAISSKFGARLFAATLVGALTVGLLELAGLARVVDYDRLFATRHGEILGSQPVPNADVAGTTWEDTSSSWGLPTQPIAFGFKTDRRGYRNETDRDAADVYLLGDSCLVGALVPFEHTLCGRLEATLKRPVMNVALIAIGVQAERDRFKAANLDVKDRLVLQFVFEGNDQSDSAAYRERESSAAVAPAARPRGSTFTWNLLMKLQKKLDPVEPISRRRTGTIAGTTYTFFWTAEQFRGREGEIPHILAALADTRRLVEAGGGRYAVVVIPDKIRILGPLCEWPAGSELTDWRAHCSPLPQAVTNWSAEQEVSVLDLTKTLAASAAAGRIPWFPGDTHWNATGHEVAAEAVARWIESLPALKPEGRR